MKVIYERTDLLNKIDTIIDTSERVIQRIELTNDEFIQFIDELLKDVKYFYSEKGHYKIACFVFKKDWTQGVGSTNHCIEYSVEKGYNCYSGSYIVYRDVCIQAHQDYKE